MSPERRARIDAILDAPIPPDQYPYLYGWLVQALAHEGVARLEDFEAALDAAVKFYEAANKATSRHIVELLVENDRSAATL
jgi:hypothetical protein